MKSFIVVAAVSSVAILAGACTVTTNNITPLGDGGLGTDSSKSSALGFTPSNVDLSGMDLSKVGDFDDTDPTCTIDSTVIQVLCGTTGADAFAFKLATQSDGTKVAVYVARTIRIEANAQLTVTGTNPIVLIALDQINLLGKLIAAGKADVASAGGFSQATSNPKGGGLGGGIGGTTTSAAGGGSYCGVGGAGAIESPGPASAGGSVFGGAEISPLVGGSSGGASDSNGGAGGV